MTIIQQHALWSEWQFNRNQIMYVVKSCRKLWGSSRTEMRLIFMIISESCISKDIILSHVGMWEHKCNIMGFKVHGLNICYQMWRYVCLQLRLLPLAATSQLYTFSLICQSLHYRQIQKGNIIDGSLLIKWLLQWMNMTFGTRQDFLKHTLNTWISVSTFDVA